MTITTIIPTFQRANLLRRAIESVLAQTWKDFCLSVYDNASEDETQLVVREYQKRDSRIRYFRHARNIGLVENFAFAVDAVSTPYFSLLCDDDYILPHFYEMCMESFRRHPNTSFCAMRTLIANAKGKFYRYQFKYPVIKGFFSSGAGIQSLLSTSQFPILTGIIFKSDITQKIGGIDKKAGYALDIELTLRFASFAPFVLLSQPGAVHTRWSGSASFIPLGIDSTDLKTILLNVEKHFTGTAQELKSVTCTIRAMLPAGIQNIWIQSLKHGHIEKAHSAKKAFFKEGGKMPHWKFWILEAAEKRELYRKLFCLYCHLKTACANLMACKKSF
jgi:GT2 family glycosyltransferase